MYKEIPNADLPKMYDNRAVHTYDKFGHRSDPVENHCVIMDSISLSNIDISLRRIAASLENGEKVKQLDKELGKAEGEIKRLVLELAATKNDLSKAEGRAAHFEAAYKNAASGEGADLQALVCKAIEAQCANEDKGDCLHCIRCGDCPTKDWVDTIKKQRAGQRAGTEVVNAHSN